MARACELSAWWLLLGVVALAASGASQPPADPRSAAQLEQELARYRHIVGDWAGLTRYGSDNSELPPPAPGEQRVVFLGDQITELWGEGRAKFYFSGLTVANGRVYIGTYDGMLYCFGLEEAARTQ